MLRKTVWSISLSLCLLCYFGFERSYADENQDVRSDIALQQAIETCRLIKIDRERLFCFDQLFDTPITLNKNAFLPELPNDFDRRPSAWKSAWNAEKTRETKQDLLSEPTSFWSTQTHFDSYKALYLTQQIDDLGLLVFSCINNISRVEVMLDKPLQDGIVPVVIHGATPIHKNWLLDDSGYILRDGRGLSSIETMRGLIGQTQFELMINDRHYIIPLENFSSQVDGLKKMCHWR